MNFISEIKTVCLNNLNNINIHVLTEKITMNRYKTFVTILSPIKAEQVYHVDKELSFS